MFSKTELHVKFDLICFANKTLYPSWFAAHDSVQAQVVTWLCVVAVPWSFSRGWLNNFFQNETFLRFSEITKVTRMCWKQSTDKEEQVMVCLLSIKRSCIWSHLLVGLTTQNTLTATWHLPFYTDIYRLADLNCLRFTQSSEMIKMYTHALTRQIGQNWSFLEFTTLSIDTSTQRHRGSYICSLDECFRQTRLFSNQMSLARLAETVWDDCRHDSNFSKPPHNEHYVVDYDSTFGQIPSPCQHGFVIREGWKSRVDSERRLHNGTEEPCMSRRMPSSVDPRPEIPIQDGILPFSLWW